MIIIQTEHIEKATDLAKTTGLTVEGVLWTFCVGAVVLTLYLLWRFSNESSKREKVYQEQINSKDSVIAAKDKIISEKNEKIREIALSHLSDVQKDKHTMEEYMKMYKDLLTQVIELAKEKTG